MADHDTHTVHLADVSVHGQGPDSWHVAACSCGWSTDGALLADEARRVADEHRNTHRHRYLDGTGCIDCGANPDQEHTDG